MKLLFSLALFFCFSLNGLAQDISSKLLHSYSQQELNIIEENNQNQYLLLEYALENAIYTASYDSEKHSGLHVIQLKTESESPSFTDFGVKITETNQYFYWESRDKVLVVKSFWVLNHEKTSRP